MQVHFPSFCILLTLLTRVASFSILNSDGRRSQTTLCMTETTTAASTRTIVDKSTLTLLEHINLNVPSQESILPFYFDVLGCGLDPRKAENLKEGAAKKTIWANCGASQFHLPFGETAQRIPGHVGLKFDSLEGLKNRLAEQQKQQQHGENQKALRSYEVGVDPRSQCEFVKLVDVYDNVFYCRVGDPSTNEDKRQPMIAPDETSQWGEYAERYGRAESDCRGIDYVEFHCPLGTAEKIALFYESVLDATTTCIDLGDGTKIAIIAFGDVDDMGKADQSLLFRESEQKIPENDGHHIAMYVGESAADFEQAFKNAEIADVVWVNPRFSDKADTLESARNWKQFRFKNIVDMETGETVFELEHEMRSIEHEAWPGPR
jgi:hypothetical protein